MSRAALAFLAATGLAAVPAHAYTTVDASDPRWPGGVFEYRVNAASFAVDGLGTSEVQAGVAEWSTDARSDVTTTRGTDVALEAGEDDVNVIHHETVAFGAGSSVLAVTNFSFIPATGTLVEADITVNGVNFDWDDPVGAGCVDTYDLRSTITHEAGHALGLGHSSESAATCNPASPSFDAVLCDATMFFSGGACDRAGSSLECDDLAGLRFLYPVGGTARADWAPESFGAPAPGAVTIGATASVSGTALNVGSLSTAGGTAALYVSASAGETSPGDRVDTAPLASVGSCRGDAVALEHVWQASDAGTRFLVVRLDDGGSTPELDELDNVVSFGPYTVPGDPVLAVSTSLLAVEATEGGPAPADRQVTVTNDGAGTFTWSAVDDRSWITVAPATGPPGTSFFVAVDHSGLAVGSHAGTVTVTAPGALGSPQLVAVELEVVAGPVLEVDPPSLDFTAAAGGTDPDDQFLMISNGGSGTLSWTATDDAPWLEVTPAAGSEAAELTVSVDTAGLAEGLHEATITIDAGSAAGSPATVDVALDLTAEAPRLVVGPASLTFSGPVGGPSPAAQSLSVTNGGSGELTFSAVDDRPWLSVTPSGGSAPAALTVAVNATGLAAGTHVGEVTIESAGADGSPAVVPVSFTLSSTPSIDLFPTSLAFTARDGGAAPPSQFFEVRNDGTGTLSYTITEAATWLGISPANGSLQPGASRSHVVSVAPQGLAVGVHEAPVTVADAAADDSPQQLVVSLEVTDRPPLGVTPVTLEFTATAANPDPAPQAVVVDTSGESGAPWSVASSAAWLSAFPPAGIGDGSFEARIDATGLAFGEHQGTLSVTAPDLGGSPRVVAVSLQVEAGPRLAVSPRSGGWTVERDASLPSALEFSVTNTGTGSLSWSVFGAPSWLSVTPTSGLAPGSFSARPRTTDLSVGRHVANLRVSAAAHGSPVTVTLTYVVEGPALVFSPPRVDLTAAAGSAVPADLVQVGARAGAQLSWSVVASTAWLAVEPTSGDTGDTLTVGVAPGVVLPPGVHDAAVVLTADGAGNTPAPLPVTVVVTSPPGPSVHPPALDLDAAVGAAPAVAARLAIDEAGNGRGDWAITASPAWLTPAPTFGETGAAVDLLLSPGGMPAGRRTGSLTVVSASESVEVPVTLTLHAGAVPRPTPAALDLAAVAGGLSDAAELRLTNVGQGPSTWLLEAAAPWLSLSRTTVTAPATLTATADAGALLSGRHATTIVVRPSGGGAELARIPVTLVVAPAGSPLARFEASPEGGCGPLAVSFANATTGGATSFAWDFGDGGTSTAFAPVHVFARAGRHRVVLTAFNAVGSSTVSREVLVRQPPFVDAGLDRVVVFEADGESTVVLEGARTAAAAPARVLQRTWTTSHGVFVDTGTEESALERPTLVASTGRGGLTLTVTLSATDDTGCTATDEATIRFLPDFDADGDTVDEFLDNCPGFSNFSQADPDGDGVGDGCDNCRLAFNPDQVDRDLNARGDVCDTLIAREVRVEGLHARPCDGVGVARVSAEAPGALRRIVLDLDADRDPASAAAAGTAAAVGATAVAGSAGRPQRVELRAPAGVPAGGALLEISLPVTSADAEVPIAVLAASLETRGGELVAEAEATNVLVAPDGDIAPLGAPDGVVDIGDVVRLLRVTVRLEELDVDEEARADLAPGADVGGSWQADPDCRIDIGDVIVALRVVVGLLSL